MERRNLLAGLAVLALSLFLVSGTAFAHATHHKQAKPQTGGGSGSAETCVVQLAAQRSWTRASSDKSSSIADIIEVECEPVYAEQYVRFSSNELYSRCQHQPRLDGCRIRAKAKGGSSFTGRARQRRQREAVI